MPLHDWNRVTAGTFHAFRLAWIAEIQRTLNGGLLPKGYYALAEQVAGEIIPDVLTLQQADDQPESDQLRQESGSSTEGAVWTVTEAPPRVSVTAMTDESMTLAVRRRRIAIRHATGDRIVALIEIVSPGNKGSKPMLEAFLEKATATLQQGYHLLLLDLWPPGAFDLFSAYVEPLKVGDELSDMPLFLAPEHYIYVRSSQVVARSCDRPFPAECVVVMSTAAGGGAQA